MLYSLRPVHHWELSTYLCEVPVRTKTRCSIFRDGLHLWDPSSLNLDPWCSQGSISCVLSSSGLLSQVCCLVHSAGWRPVGRGWAAAGPRHSPHQDRRRLRAGCPHRYRAPGQDQRQCPCRHEEHWAPDPDGEDHAGLQSVRYSAGLQGVFVQEAVVVCWVLRTAQNYPRWLHTDLMSSILVLLFGFTCSLLQI